LDLDRERALQQLIVKLAEDRLIRSADDCSDGGIAITLAESCFDSGEMGAEISIDSTDVSADQQLNDAAALFGESASRIVVSAAADDVTRILELAAGARVPAQVIGQTGGNRLRIATGGRMTIDMATSDAERVWSAAIDSSFAKKIA
jgi:phosphoribosylformylglycinamidine synthase